MSDRTSEIFELIEQYLEGGLTPDQQRTFEERIAEDPWLKEEVSKHLALNEALQDFDAIDFRKRVKGVIENPKNNNVLDTSTRKRTIYWSVAAILLIFIGSAVFWPKQQNKTLFELYYEAYPVEDRFRGEMSLKFEKVLDDYSEHRYDDAIMGLNTLISEFPENLELQMYLGNSFLNMDQEVMAINVFKNLVDNKIYSEHAKWYLALAYTKLEQKNNASSVLGELIKYNGLYKDKASDLLEKLQAKQLNTEFRSD